VNKGEVVGLAGLVGSGRTELLRAIFGADRSSGEVLLNGQKLWPRNPASAVGAGLGFLTEDRKEQGLFLPLTMRENISIASLGRLSRMGVVKRKAEAEAAEQARQELRIRSRSIEQSAARLSGGNQQKVVLARWLARNCDVLLLDEPTRGIDIGARHEIYELVERMAHEGKSILMASSDLNELLALCDRIVVMSSGKVVDELSRDKFDSDRIMTAALRSHGVASV
jgi:ribose transport system ATP-binding protein